MTRLGPLKTETIAAMIAVSLIVPACAMGASDAKQTPVEVWRGGDDGATLRLTDALEATFRASPAFVLSSGKKPGTLVVTIPTHVGWKQIGGRNQVLYTVEFTSADGRNLGTATGSCWDDALSECADQIIRDAANAMKRF
jgi:hypothetical protein